MMKKNKPQLPSILFVFPVFVLVISLLLLACEPSVQADKVSYTVDELWIKGKNRLLIIDNTNGKYGFINKDSTIIIPPQYDTAYYFNLDSLTLVRKNNKWGVITESGKAITACIYDSIDAYGWAEGYDFQDYFVANENGNAQLLHISGRVLLSNYEYLKKMIYSNLLIAQLDQKYGLIDTLGTPIIPLEYDDFRTYLGSTSLKKDGKWGLFYESGEQVLETAFDSISLVMISQLRYEGLVFMVKQNNKWGLISNQGEWVIPNQYDKMTYNERKKEVIYE